VRGFSCPLLAFRFNPPDQGTVDDVVVPLCGDGLGEPVEELLREEGVDGELIQAHFLPGEDFGLWEASLQGLLAERLFGQGAGDSAGPGGRVVQDLGW